MPAVVRAGTRDEVVAEVVKGVVVVVRVVEVVSSIQPALTLPPRSHYRNDTQKKV